MGALLLYTLMAAEIYSAYAFLGVAGWAYSYGMPIMYALAYGSLAYAFGYFYAKYIWKAGKRFGYVTQADYFMHRFNSKALAVFTALIGIVFIIPYVQLQLQGLGYILHVGSLNALSINLSMAIALTVVLIYVYTSGLRGIAWTNFLQGIFMFIIAWGVVFAIPFLKFGGIGPLFRRLLETKPQMLYLHPPLGMTWYLSTMILSGLGFFIWPHLWPSIFGAKDIKPLKKTYVVLPLYSFFMLPVILAGLNVAAAGLTASNIYRIAKPSASDKELVLVSRLFVVFYALLALGLAIVARGRLVALLLLGYSGITQMFPGAVLGMFWKRINKWNTAAVL